MPKTIGLRVTDSLNAAIEKKAASEGYKPSGVLRRLSELWLAGQIDIRGSSSEKPSSLPSERPVQARKPKTPSPETCEHEWVTLPLTGRSVCEKCGGAR